MGFLLGKGMSEGQRIEWPAGAQLYVVVSISSAAICVLAIPSAQTTFLQNSVSSRQSIPGLRSASSLRGDVFYVILKTCCVSIIYFALNYNPEPINLLPLSFP